MLAHKAVLSQLVLQDGLKKSLTTAGDPFTAGHHSLLQRVIASPAYRQAPPLAPPTTWSPHFRFRSVAGNGLLAAGPAPIRQLKHMCKNVRSFVPSGAAQRRGAAPAPWRRHPTAAMEMLFNAVPVTRHRAAAAAVHFPPTASAARGGATYLARQHRLHAVSRDPRPASRDPDGQLSLLSLLLEASGTSCCRAMTSSSTSLSTSQLWKAAINN